MTTTVALAHLATALALGLLLGMEREHSNAGRTELTAGSRTFALLGLGGGVAAALGHDVLMVGLGGVAAIVVAGYWLDRRGGSQQDAGATTEVAAVLAYLLGALAWHRPELAVPVGIVVVALLAARRPLHRLATRVISDRDVTDGITLFVVAFVILPILPDRPLGPYGVLNPSRIWLLVVVLTLIGWAGYLGARIVGARWGLMMVGFAGGFVSGSATTAVMARQSKEGVDALPAALALNIPTLVQAVAVTAVVNVDVAVRVAIGAGAGVLVLVAEIGWLLRRSSRASARAALAGDGRTGAAERAAVESGVARQGEAESGMATDTRAEHPDHADDRERAGAAQDSLVGRPMSLWAAVVLAAILVVLLVGTRAAADLLGAAGAVAAAAIGGLADAHAASLAAASVAGQTIAVATAVLAVGAALATNTVVKLGLAVAAGSAGFAGRLACWLVAPVAAAAAGLLAGAAL